MTFNSCCHGKPTRLAVNPNLKGSGMCSERRWAELLTLDDDLLKGGVVLSEWCARIVCDADTAYAAGAFLATILTAVSGIETYLRSEYPATGRPRLADLINAAELPRNLKADLHSLRCYRNRWVHVDTPDEDETLLADPESVDLELESMARFAARALRRTIYSVQSI